MKTFRYALPGSNRWHIVESDARLTNCGIDVVTLANDPARPREIPEDHRCRRPACAAAWPANLRLVS